MIPGGVERRSAAREASRPGPLAATAAWRPAEFAAAIDTVAVVSAASLVTLISPALFWTSGEHDRAGLLRHVHRSDRSSPGMRLTEALQQRLPALFAVQDRRAHA